MIDTRKRLLALADSLEPSVAREFVRAIQSIQSQAQLGMIVAAIEAGNIDDVVRILQIRPETFGLFEEQIRSLVIQGAAYQLDSVPKKTKDPETGARLIARFGGSQPRAQAIVQRVAGDLITAITDTVRQEVRDIVEGGLADGLGADKVARHLIGTLDRTTGERVGGAIGILPAHAETVRDIERALREGDTDRMRSYLRLARRDKRYDRTIRKAIKDGKALNATQARTISRRLADGYLRLRGDAIARSETIPALNSGRREATQQLIDRGVIAAWQVERMWDATGDARTRLDHLRMEGQQVNWGVPFTFPDGSQAMGPGDTSLGAPGSQTVNCRCYEDIKIDWLAGAI